MHGLILIERVFPAWDPARCGRRALAAIATLLWIACSNAQPARPVDSLLEQRQRGVVIQRWDLSCGAAALATILNFQHGDPVSEREIAIGMMSRDDYLANPDIVSYRQGFSMLDLKRYVDGRGYNGVGLGRLSLEDLNEFAPIIVPISLHGYRHFVVYRGMRGDRVFMADPAFGNRTMSVQKFEQSWLVLAELGRVGFYVERTDSLIPPNRLAIDNYER